MPEHANLQILDDFIVETSEGLAVYVHAGDRVNDVVEQLVFFIK